MTRITETLASGQIDVYRDLLQRYETENNVPAIDIAAAMAKLLQGDSPFLLTPPVRGARNDCGDRGERSRSERTFERGPRADSERAVRPPRGEDAAGERPRRDPVAPRGDREFDMETYRIEVGHTHGVKPANIVGAIANEAGLESRYIGRIDIQHDYSIVDLPADMPRELLNHLKKVWVSGQQLNMRKLEEGQAAASPSEPRFRRGGKPSGRPNGLGRPMDRAGAPHRKGPPKPRGE